MEKREIRKQVGSNRIVFIEDTSEECDKVVEKRTEDDLSRVIVLESSENSNASEETNRIEDEGFKGNYNDKGGCIYLNGRKEEDSECTSGYGRRGMQTYLQEFVQAESTEEDSSEAAESSSLENTTEDIGDREVHVSEYTTEDIGDREVHVSEYSTEESESGMSDEYGNESLDDYGDSEDRQTSETSEDFSGSDVSNGVEDRTKSLFEEGFVNVMHYSQFLMRVELSGYVGVPRTVNRDFTVSDSNENAVLEVERIEDYSRAQGEVVEDSDPVVLESKVLDYVYPRVNEELISMILVRLYKAYGTEIRNFDESIKGRRYAETRIGETIRDFSAAEMVFLKKKLETVLRYDMFNKEVIKRLLNLIAVEAIDGIVQGQLWTNWRITGKRYSRLGNAGSKSCGICYQDFKRGSFCSKLKCKHVFHTKCIKRWTRKLWCCPICREKEIA